MRKKTEAAASPNVDVRVAYHDGPPSIHFAGLVWHQGAAQTVTAEKWTEMRERGDFKEFDFREVPDEAPAPAGDNNNTEA